MPGQYTGSQSQKKVQIHLKIQLSRIYNQKCPERVQNIQKRKYLKRKIAHNDSEHSVLKRLKITYSDKSLETLEKRPGYPMSAISISKATEICHKNISVGPEYTRTCCDQPWYRSSVKECNASIYISHVPENFIRIRCSPSETVAQMGENCRQSLIFSRFEIFEPPFCLPQIRMRISSKLAQRTRRSFKI